MSHPARPSSLRPFWGALFLVLLGLGAFLGPAGCREERDPFALSPDTPVVLVMVDTLRAESLGLYGYELDTSPVLDRFAETAYVFENGTTQCNATLPSITSTLTSLYVRTHRNYISVPVEGMVRPDASIKALPERMQEAGYETIATISHPSWRKAPDSPGFARGWDILTIIPDSIPIELRPLAATGQYTNERTFKSLALWEQANQLRAERRARGEKGVAVEEEKPLFLLSHYFDPHSDIE
ncbi:MAG: sulfatase-like hydrolase/transferase, partial [Planctomycetota bacterium]